MVISKLKGAYILHAQYIMLAIPLLVIGYSQVSFLSQIFYCSSKVVKETEKIEPILLLHTRHKLILIELK